MTTRTLDNASSNWSSILEVRVITHVRQIALEIAGGAQKHAFRPLPTRWRIGDPSKLINDLLRIPREHKVEPVPLPTLLAW